MSSTTNSYSILSKSKNYTILNIYRQYEDNPIKAFEKIKIVLNWKVISKDNILIALLSHNYDSLALKYMGYYSHFLDKDLFIYCVTHGNTFFLQKALYMAAFDKNIFRDEGVINEIL